MNLPPTIAEACSLLDCSTRRVFELLAEGVLIRAPRYGRRTRITLESIQAALEAPAPKPHAAKRPRRRSREGFAAEIAAVVAQARKSSTPKYERPDSK